MTRGMDYSFGYNAAARPSDFVTADQVRSLVTAARQQRGRLLLNVGPMANGTLPEPQQKVLTDLASRAL